VVIETPEQRQLRADLIKRFGALTFKRAMQLSGLQMCLIGLGADELTFEERAHLVRQASMHLAELIDTAVPAAESAKLVECARRIDTAVELWLLDEKEEREGLPPPP
jgi:hypothetical protein